MQKSITILILICLFAFQGFCQESDSLIKRLDKTKGIEKDKTFHNLIMGFYYQGDFDSAYYWANKRLKFAEKLGNDSVMVQALIRMGRIHEKWSEYDIARQYYRDIAVYSKKHNYEYGLGMSYLKLAVAYYKEVELDSSLYYNQKAKELFTRLNEKEKLTVALSGLGNCNIKKGNLVEALNNYFSSLEIEQARDDTAGMASSYQNIGAVYYYQDDEEQALKYFLLALKYKELMGNEGALIGSYHNVGAIYISLSENDSSMLYYRKALGLSKKLNVKEFIALSSTAIGSLHFSMQHYDSARIYLDDALRIQEEINDRMSIVYTLKELGIMEAEIGSWQDAVSYLNRAKNLGEEEGLAIELSDVYEQLYMIYEKRKQFDKALINYKKFVAVKDTLFNEEVQEKTIKMDMQHQFDREVLEDSLNHAQEKLLMEANAARQEAEIKAGKQQKYLLFGGLLLIISFLAFVFNRLKVTRKQKSQIEEQKQEVESAHELLAEHHSEIQDSINYAKRIQDAIMPSKESMLDVLKKAFVVYLPKDVVAGDFFWMERVDGVVYFAAADCTGHGVPGAMVSVVCSTALTKALLEEKIRDTGALLDRTRELVINQLAKSGEEVKDGMDISLCALNTQTNRIQWSGANNPLWILRKGAQEIDEKKPDKQPIGIHSNPKPFTSYEFQLNLGDTVYVFTDGYQDQFGGYKGKKFKAAQLKQLLLANQSVSIEKQGEILIEAFENWKGDLEQIDDVCVIGVRI